MLLRVSPQNSGLCIAIASGPDGAIVPIQNAWPHPGVRLRAHCWFDGFPCGTTISCPFLHDVSGRGRRVGLAEGGGRGGNAAELEVADER